jgi:hypothetical protein
MATPRTREFVEQCHKAPLHANLISYSHRDVSPLEEVDGWYYLDGSGLHGLALVRDRLDHVLVVTYACSTVGKRYNLPPPTVEGCTTLVGRKLGGRRYHFPALDDAVFVSDPVSGSLHVDLSVPASLLCASNVTRPRSWVRVRNEDERLWSYAHRLADLSSRFNDLPTFLEFAYNHYLSGTLTGFGIGGSGVSDGRLNALGHTYTQIRRSYGSKTRGEYDDVYRRLCTTGMSRKYGVKRLVHWPLPGSCQGASAATLKAMQWCVNQQRYDALGIVLSVRDEGRDAFALLCPGERVILRGSGTRLDGVPLRLSLSGYHTGPKPDRTHIPDWMHESWSYYTLRLPWVITRSNGTVYYREPGADVDVPFCLTPGTYYLSEVVDLVSRHCPTLWCTVDESTSRFHLFAHPGTLVNSPHKRVNPSTLLGAGGLDIGHLWGTRDALVAGMDGRVVATDAGVDPLGSYGYYTPLTGSELNTLVSSVSRMTVEVQHGPVSSTMDYDNLVACLLELSVASSCESGSVLVPYTRMGELYTDSATLVEALTSSQQGGRPMACAHVTPFGGHPGEGSDMYRPSGGVRVTSRLPWIAPGSGVGSGMGSGSGVGMGSGVGSGSVLFYGPGVEVLVDGETYSLAGRAVDHTVVNALDNPKWLLTYPDPATGSATVDLLPYPLHESVYSSNPNAIRDARVVDGEWLVGTVKESWVRRALGLAADARVPRIGYLTHHAMTCSLSGTVERTSAAYTEYSTPEHATYTTASFLMGKVLRYFNSFAVQHVIIDPRSSAGGSPDVWRAFAEHCGADRRWRDTLITSQNQLDPTGVDLHLDSATVGACQERSTQAGYSARLDCSPSRTATAFPPQELFRGPVTDGVPGMSTTRNVVWISTSTASSAAQVVATSLRGCSVPAVLEDGTKVHLHDGSWGENVWFVTYGSHSRLSSATRTERAALGDWYARGRRSGEEVPVPPVVSLGRGELSRSGRVGDGGVITASDQSFSRLEEPNVLWDMDSSVFFQDVGYVLPAAFDADVYGQPWLQQRHADVTFLDPRTWRDTVLDRCIRIATDPDLRTHFFRRDGYGKVTAS